MENIISEKLLNFAKMDVQIPNISMRLHFNVNTAPFLAQHVMGEILIIA
jgi:hypothetical protein